jgi:hypothetical protein
MDERFFRIMKHWLKAGDPDPYYSPNTDFVILPPKEFEIEEQQEETVSLAGSFLDMDDCTGASQQGEYVATISTGTVCCFILLSDGLVVIDIVVTYSQFDSNIRVFYVFLGFLKNT